MTDSDSELRTTLSRTCIVRGRKIPIPDGWKIAKGDVRPRDKFLCMKAFVGGDIVFRLAWPVATSMDVYHHSSGYALLIRPIG